jgi:hypothetical protein
MNYGLDDDDYPLDRYQAAALSATLIGRTIVAAEGKANYYGPESVALTLDDGRAVIIEGWGYDEWGINVYVKEPL